MQPWFYHFRCEGATKLNTCQGALEKINDHNINVNFH